MDPLRLVAQPTRTTTPTLGDVLFRLSLIAPDDYRAIDALARSLFQKRWPYPERDPLDLLPTGTH